MSELEFLRRVLQGIDRWFDAALTPDDLNHSRGLLRDRLAALDAALEPADPDDRSGGDPVIEVIGAELHQLRRDHACATRVTRSGYLHQHVRVRVVRRHHTVLDSDTHPTVLLPLRFIESVQPLNDPIRQE
ncbi:hypothetical protein AB4305_03305 [Nocardia sp. 2YAB30]|uniref:hypothetical protein n=1 Tax=unclassified Nocardia TaxID=2637762 RepID=UPI003F94AB86